MISSFQLTRSAKLSLAHQMTPINADERKEKSGKTRWKDDNSLSLSSLNHSSIEFLPLHQR